MFPQEGLVRILVWDGGLPCSWTGHGAVPDIAQTHGELVLRARHLTRVIVTAFHWPHQINLDLRIDM
jgi:hypothetical protein